MPVRWLVLLSLAAAAGCARPAPIIQPGASTASIETSLASADALVRDGCFDCLEEALQRFEALQREPSVADRATTGAVMASGLLAIRERELGTTDSGYAAKARTLVASSPATAENLAPLLDVVDLLPWRAGGGPARAPEQALTLFRNREARMQDLSARASANHFAAYVWLAFACDTGAAATLGRQALVAAIGGLADEPLIAFKLAICPGVDAVALNAVVNRPSRFPEAAYFFGVAASGARKLDEAATRYDEAHRWRETWPAVTFALANLSMANEEFDPALRFYDRTLAMTPWTAAALLGRLRALTYLDRPADAIVAADDLVSRREFPGDAYYWKAYNELALQRIDDAWRDIESANALLINADVPKLAGLIAMRQQNTGTARSRFELAHMRNQADCETSYYLSLTLGELKAWEPLVQTAADAASCLDGAETQTREEINGIRASSTPEERKMRLIARREQQIAAGARMRATALFNAAVASYNLMRPSDALNFAQRVANDEQFGERARDIIARSRK